jgi:hypothetical protein
MMLEEPFGCLDVSNCRVDIPAFCEQSADEEVAVLSGGARHKRRPRLHGLTHARSLGCAAMNVLFVANQEPDFLQDVVFHGLVSVLGADHVIDWPPVERYRIHPPPEAVLPMLYFAFPPRPAISDADAFAWADAIVLGSSRPEAMGAVRRALAIAAGRPVAFLDGEDDPYVRAILRNVDVYFKRETLLHDPARVAAMPLRRLRDLTRVESRSLDPLARRRSVATHRSRSIVPLPFGIVDTGFAPVGARDVDLAFLASPTSPERERVTNELERLKAEGLRVVMSTTRLPWAEYMQVLATSRVAISLRGLGYDTYRYWEIPYAGALLLAETPQIVIPRNFEHAREAWFAPVDSLAGSMRKLLGGDTDAIAAAGRARLMSEHSSVRRAETVLERLDAVKAKRGSPLRSPR